MSNGKKKIGLQLWTVRDEIERDLPGTLRAIKEIGYEGVELWFKQLPKAIDLKKYLTDSSLAIAGSHVKFLDLRDKPMETFDYHRELGNNHLIIQAIPDPLRKTKDDWIARIEELKIIAEHVRNAGFQFSYHNHAEEYRDTIDGVEICEYMFKHIPADILSAELDTYFMQLEKRIPADYIKRYGNRIKLLHIKDQHTNPAYMNSSVGSGTIDWNAVFKAVAETRIEWLIVEQNCQDAPALPCIAESWKYVSDHGFA